MIYRDAKGRFCKAPSIKGYKGFEQGLICLEKQYKVGEVFTESEAVLCKSGIHFCKNPLHVFEFYPPVSNTGIPNEYAEVEALEEIVTDDNIKFCTTKLKVVRKLSLEELIQAGINYTLQHSKNVKESTGDRSTASNTSNYSTASNIGFYSAASNTGAYSTASNIGFYSAASNTGAYSAASNTGNYSVATNTGAYSAASNIGFYSAASNTGAYSAASNTGNYSVASNIGYCSSASNTGNSSVASNTGDCSAVTNTGNYSAATSTGNRSAASNTGDCSAATNTGYYSVASVSGKHSIAVNTGHKGKVKGALGCWIACAEWRWNAIVNFKSAYVDGKKIKADTWYRLEDGKFVEAN